MGTKADSNKLLKQILQLKNDRIGIRQIARRTGMSCNSVRKYLSQLDDGSDPLSDKELSDKAYKMNTLKVISMHRSGELARVQSNLLVTQCSQRLSKRY